MDYMRFTKFSELVINPFLLKHLKILENKITSQVTFSDGTMYEFV